MLLSIGESPWPFLNRSETLKACHSVGAISIPQTKNILRMGGLSFFPDLLNTQLFTACQALKERADRASRKHGQKRLPKQINWEPFRGHYLGKPTFGCSLVTLVAILSSFESRLFLDLPFLRCLEFTTCSQISDLHLVNISMGSTSAAPRKR